MVNIAELFFTLLRFLVILYRNEIASTHRVTSLASVFAIGATHHYAGHFSAQTRQMVNGFLLSQPK